MTPTMFFPLPNAHTASAAALVACPELGRAELARLVRGFGDPACALRELLAAGGSVEPAHPKLRRARAEWLSGPIPTRIAAITQRRATGATWIGRDDWPISERIPDEPAILLTEGSRPEALSSICVAVVGTRAATPHGTADAREIGSTIARAGATVVSGLAIGVDAAAHEGALDAGGLAVGVVATGLDVVYPRRHNILFDRVRRQGVLVSEAAYGVQPQRWRFPVRNRIIAALADVVVVVEATLRGGARITADDALEFGRPVLAVPGSRRNPAAAGCNALIADGAHPLLDPTDVLVAIGFTSVSPAQPSCRPASPEESAIIGACSGEPATADELCERTGLEPAEVARTVRRLERSGLVSRRQGLVWPI